jgi:protein-disulfide isomerase
MQSKQTSDRWIKLLIGLVLALLVGVVAVFVVVNRQLVSSLPPKPSPVVGLPKTMRETLEEVPATRPTDIVIGDPKKASVVLVQYTDLECPYCKRMHPDMKTLLLDEGKDVALIYRHFPLSIHPAAPLEAEVAVCVDEQGDKFSAALVDLTYTESDVTGTSYTQDQYVDLAVRVGARRDKIVDCLASGRGAARVEADIAEGRSLGVRATPSTFLYNKSKKVVFAEGALELADFKQAVAYLKR